MRLWRNAGNRSYAKPRNARKRNTRLFRTRSGFREWTRTRTTTRGARRRTRSATPSSPATRAKTRSNTRCASARASVCAARREAKPRARRKRRASAVSLRRMLTARLPSPLKHPPSSTPRRPISRLARNPTALSLPGTHASCTLLAPPRALLGKIAHACALCTPRLA